MPERGRRGKKGGRRRFEHVELLFRGSGWRFGPFLRAKGRLGKCNDEAEHRPRASSRLHLSLFHSAHVVDGLGGEGDQQQRPRGMSIVSENKELKEHIWALLPSVFCSNSATYATAAVMTMPVENPKSHAESSLLAQTQVPAFV
ncbi:hypothetical protein LZ31DRAFT_150715 [Colletotrichum somersetense]|nr:hypothetical protein LZ31DRAFT_150715 [Colletotrichum somersetense]